MLILKPRWGTSSLKIKLYKVYSFEISVTCGTWSFETMYILANLRPFMDSFDSFLMRR